MSTKNSRDPFDDPNVRYFILFRVFFNARYYYPIFSILFLDFGLSLEQFAILNSIWALTIILCEVPSGALADIIGRKKLVCTASFLMIIEIGVLCWVPLENPNIVFIAFIINRVLSGITEAAASGADEALAFDSLKEKKLDSLWPRVLEKLTRWQSFAFFFAMIIGAVIYDPQIMAPIADWLGLNIKEGQRFTLRWPLWLTLIHAIITFYCSLKMQECHNNNEHLNKASLWGAFRKTFQTGRWILKTPFVLLVILAGFTFDSLIRLFATLASEYYRHIDLPEASFGIIGACSALLGIAVAKLAKYLTQHHSPLFNATVLAIITFGAFIGISFSIPYWGLIFGFIAFSGMPLINFFLSHYLNTHTDSSHRATVLSFKGLMINLGYGLVGLLYAALIAELRNSHASEEVFTLALKWFPWSFIIMFVGLLFTGCIILKDKSVCLRCKN